MGPVGFEYGREESGMALHVVRTKIRFRKKGKGYVKNKDI
jgi:hypothetical protein